MQFFKQRSRNVAPLVGTVLIGSVVEAHEPNKIHQNRFSLRCRCGELFFAQTPAIRKHQESRRELVCARCRMAPKLPEEAQRVTGIGRRCEHGFVLGDGLCTQCRPEGIRCAICGEEHPSKLCTATPTGRRRLQHKLNPGLAASRSSADDSTRLQLDESEPLGRSEEAVCP